MKHLSAIVIFSALLSAAENDPAHWPSWRGPNENGIARTPVPAEWSATKNIAWKVEIPGKGNSSPVIWGDRIFITTAVPSEAIGRPAGGRGGGAGGGTGAGIEHKFVLMSLDRKTGSAPH